MPLAHVHSEYGYRGQNVTPVLIWENAPQEAKSFAITMFDPDAKMGKGRWHWAVVDIPPHVNTISAEDMPNSAIQIRNDFGSYKYEGPCPRVGGGRRRYIFTVYALDVEKLDVTPDVSPWDIKKVIERRKISEGFLTSFCDSRIEKK